jgi:HrpA-like RNA helicase
MSVSSSDEDFDILPVEGFREELLAYILENQIVICIGETGSGVAFVNQVK